MIISSAILFFSALFGGLLIYLFPNQKGNSFRLSLTFAGAYLFSITIIHIIPEVYSHRSVGLNMGIYMLLGYFFQQILEYFSSGIEHGHLHHYQNQHSDNHHQSGIGVFSVMAALSIHSFLEGGMLAYPSYLHESHQNNTLLAGIVLHKLPAAYALMSIISFRVVKKNRQLILLLIFALASPMGLLVSQYGNSNQWISQNTSLILFAIVCGSFLQISTTIVFESSPQHKFDIRRFGVAAAGAFTAIVSELI